MTNSSTGKLSISLTYLERFKIKDKSLGLEEPSGLELSRDKTALWTVSDDTKKLFKLNLRGEIDKDESFKISDKGLEGIVLDPPGKFFLAVREEGNMIVKIDAEKRKIIERQPLAEVSGFDAIQGDFDGGGGNKGLEGIAWNRKTGTIFVMKEGQPGLLVELPTSLDEIRSLRSLNADNGFLDDDVSGKALDFSDICYDEQRDLFWIVSDQAQRLFAYDWEQDRVVQSFRLSYGHKGEFRQIEKAEGVAIDPEAQRLFVVSDEEARLYVFDVRE